MAILFVAILLLNSYPDPELDLAGGYLGAYFVVSQLAFLCLVFALARVDWSYALTEHKLRFKRDTPGENART